MKIIKRGRTTNYGIFNFLSVNRKVRPDGIKKLAASFKTKNLMAVRPAICIQKDKKLWVIDGQHGIEAAKLLKIPVEYVVCVGIDPSDIALLNSKGGGPWATKDFLHYYCENGSKEYLRLAEFVKQYKFPLTVAVQLLGGSVADGSSTAKLVPFKDGHFQVKDIEFAKSVAATCDVLAKAGCRFSRLRSLVKAIAHIKQVFPLDDEKFARRLAYIPFQARANWKQYAEQIEEIYNYRRACSDKVSIVTELKKAGLYNQ